jgi:hypothetical protein
MIHFTNCYFLGVVFHINTSSQSAPDPGRLPLPSKVQGYWSSVQHQRILRCIPMPSWVTNEPKGQVWGLVEEGLGIKMLMLQITSNAYDVIDRRNLFPSKTQNNNRQWKGSPYQVITLFSLLYWLYSECEPLKQLVVYFQTCTYLAHQNVA